MDDLQEEARAKEVLDKEAEGSQENNFTSCSLTFLSGTVFLILTHFIRDKNGNMFEQLGRLIGFTRRSNENLSPERKQEIEDIMNAQRALLDGVKEVVVCANSFDLGKRTFLILNEDGTGAARIREHRLTRVPASK